MNYCAEEDNRGYVIRCVDRDTGRVLYCGSVINQIDRMMQGIRRRTNTGFFREVEAVPAKSGMSLVFNMAPSYRELYRCYLLL